MRKYTTDQLTVLKEIRRLLENLDQHPFGLYVPYTNFLQRFPISSESYYGDAQMLITKCYELKKILPDVELFRDNELNSTANDEVERLNGCKGRISKNRIINYMCDATIHLKRDLRGVLELLEECKDSL